MGSTGSSRGFFFVLITLIILSYILASVSLWSKSIQVSERAYAEKFRISNLEMVVDQISEQKLAKIAEVAAYGALNSMTDKSVDQPLRPGSDAEGEDYYVREAFWNLAVNGTIPSSDFADAFPDYKDPDADSYALSMWFGQLNSTISAAGLTVDKYEITEMRFAQQDIDRLNYSLRVSFIVADKGGTVRMERDYKINGTVNIKGQYDPAIGRASKDKPTQVLKQFFFLRGASREPGPYKTPADVNVKLIQSGHEGQGWFYGPVVDVAGAPGVSMFARNDTILMGTYSEITSLIGSGAESAPHWTNFGAYILTNEPVNTGSCNSGHSESGTLSPVTCDSNGAIMMDQGRNDYTEKPFTVLPGISIDKIPSYNYAQIYVNQGIPNRRALFVSRYTAAEIRSSPLRKFDSSPMLYNMEPLRDFAVCGYYMNSSDAPSYIQRLFRDSYSYNDSRFGIETFAFGQWISEKPGYEYRDGLSRLDRELFQGTDGKKVRGMPGCKSPEMSTDPESQIGHFRISNNPGKVSHISPATAYIGTDFVSRILCKNDECTGVD